MVARPKFKVTLPDIEYYREQILCQWACPINTGAGRYVCEIASSNYEEAYSIARSPNPLVYSLGRVCGHPCETACRRGHIDEPISIRALKRAATDHHDLSRGHHSKIVKAEKKEEKVAVIGSGPSGLSAAHDLSIMGYEVTIFESRSVAGGMLHLGIPEYRLPRDIIELEIEAIQKLGVKIELNKILGKDFSLKDLKERGFKAIFIAIGAHKSRDLQMEGVELDGVLKGVDFLLNVNLGYKVDMGDRALVIGGGNVAIDVARSAVRQIKNIDSMSTEEMRETLKSTRGTIDDLTAVKEVDKDEMTTAVDVARSALRMGAKEVTMVCLESREEMPAHKEEVEDTLKEGISILNSLGPRRIVGKAGKAIGLETIKVKSVFDDKGRFNPVFIENTESIVEADTIIMAIGQTSDLSFIKEEDKIKISSRSTIETDPETMATTAEGIFAGGDVALGPRLVVDAVADGRKAARAIDDYIKGEKSRSLKGKMTVLKDHKMPDHFDEIPRQISPTISTDRRIGLSEVELPLPEENAVTEGKRCLKCSVNTVFNGNLCILCGGCVDVCPEQCLKLVKPDDLEKGEELKKLYKKKFGSENPMEVTAIIKNEDKCIRCALCAERCPTDAITMELFEWEETTTNG